MFSRLLGGLTNCKEQHNLQLVNKLNYKLLTNVNDLETNKLSHRILYKISPEIIKLKCNKYKILFRKNKLLNLFLIFLQKSFTYFFSYIK